MCLLTYVLKTNYKLHYKQAINHTGPTKILGKVSFKANGNQINIIETIQKVGVLRNWYYRPYLP